jgi:hypothetical protein
MWSSVFRAGRCCTFTTRCTPGARPDACTYPHEQGALHPPTLMPASESGVDHRHFRAGVQPGHRHRQRAYGILSQGLYTGQVGLERWQDHLARSDITGLPTRLQVQFFNPGVLTRLSPTCAPGI